MNYIYLLQEREFIKTNESIYKIGRTKQEQNKRFKQYPKNSKLLLQIECDDCVELEKYLLKIFKDKYKQRKDIGNEYFEGDPKNMINDIFDNVMEENIKVGRCVIFTNSEWKSKNIDEIADELIKNRTEDIRIMLDKHKSALSDSKIERVEQYLKKITDVTPEDLLDHRTNIANKTPQEQIVADKKFLNKMKKISLT